MRGKLGPLIFKYISLNILGMLAFSCYLLADTFFIANGVGADGLAALNIAIPAYSIMHGTGLMLGIGGATVYARKRAVGDDGAASVFTFCLLAGLAAGLVIMTAGLCLSGPLARLLGADDAVFADTAVYLKTVLAFAPFFVINNIAAAFVRNDGNPKLSMLGMAAGSFLNIVLDYVFVYPCGMGMFGAALATGCAPAIGIAVSSLHLLKKDRSLRFRRPKGVRPGKVCAPGLPSLVNELSSGAVMLTFNFIILGIAGNTGLAAYGVIANLALVIVSLFTGTAQGIQPLISVFDAEGETHKRRVTLLSGLATALVISGAVYLFGVLFREQLVAVFNRDSDPVMASLAISGLPVYFAGFFFAGLNVVLISYAASVGKTKTSFAVSLMRGMVVIIPAAFLLSSLFSMAGVWAAFPVSEAVTLIAAVILLRLRPLKRHPRPPAAKFNQGESL